MMNKDQMAVYLNEHPEFFNEYPELLQKIQSLPADELPLKKLSTLSLADRLVKRAHDDKENMKSKLEWFVELTQANEKIQQHIFEIESLVLTSTDLGQMAEQLCEEITRRFDIKYTLVYLVDGTDHLMEYRLRERFPKGTTRALKFIDQATADQWFDGEPNPVLIGEVKGDSKVFTNPSLKGKIKSEAIIPVMIQKTLVGVIAMGAGKPLYFYDGLRTDYLERMADKLAIAINNILLIDRLKN